MPDLGDAMHQTHTKNSPRNREKQGTSQHRAALTCRERAVANLLLRGLSNPRIGFELGISPYTVRDHVSAMLVKFRFDNRVQLVAHLAQLRVAESNSE